MSNKKEYMREYAIKNKEKIALYQKEYLQKNKEKIVSYKRNWTRKKRGTDLDMPVQIHVKDNKVALRIGRNMRRRLNLSLKHTGTLKNNSTMNYVGCSKEELIKHLESQFTEGMSWDNYGEWHIDHIIPLSSFDLTKEKNLYKSMNYGNLQPLWKADNLKKSNKLSTVCG